MHSITESKNNEIPPFLPLQTDQPAPIGFIASTNSTIAPPQYHSQAATSIPENIHQAINATTTTIPTNREDVQYRRYYKLRKVYEKEGHARYSYKRGEIDQLYENLGLGLQLDNPQNSYQDRIDDLKFRITKLANTLNSVRPIEKEGGISTMNTKISRTILKCAYALTSRELMGPVTNNMVDIDQRELADSIITQLKIGEDDITTFDDLKQKKEMTDLLLDVLDEVFIKHDITKQVSLGILKKLIEGMRVYFDKSNDQERSIEEMEFKQTKFSTLNNYYLELYPQ